MTIEKIRKILTDNLNLQKIEIIDQSHKHIGHSGWKKGISTHFDLLIVSQSFENKSQLQRHRMVYSLLKEDLQEYIHALSIKAFTPAEYSSNS